MLFLPPRDVSLEPHEPVARGSLLGDAELGPSSRAAGLGSPSGLFCLVSDASREYSFDSGADVSLIAFVNDGAIGSRAPAALALAQLSLSPDARGAKLDLVIPRFEEPPKKNTSHVNYPHGRV